MSDLLDGLCKLNGLLLSLSKCFLNLFQHFYFVTIRQIHCEFHNVIYIWWKYHFSVILFVAIILPEIFTHATAAMLWQKFAVSIWLKFGWEKIKFSSNLNNDRKTVKEIGIRHCFLPLTDHAEPDLSLWEKTLNKASTNEAIWYIFTLLNLVKIKIKTTTQGNPRSLQMRLVLPLPLTQTYVCFVMSCLVQVDTGKVDTYWCPKQDSLLGDKPWITQGVMYLGCSYPGCPNIPGTYKTQSSLRICHRGQYNQEHAHWSVQRDVHLTTANAQMLYGFFSFRIISTLLCSINTFGVWKTWECWKTSRALKSTRS